MISNDNVLKDCVMCICAYICMQHVALCMCVEHS